MGRCDCKSNVAVTALLGSGPAAPAVGSGGALARAPVVVGILGLPTAISAAAIAVAARGGGIGVNLRVAILTRL